MGNKILVIFGIGLALLLIPLLKAKPSVQAWTWNQSSWDINQWQ